jgi:hypothetical protein
MSISKSYKAQCNAADLLFHRVYDLAPSFKAADEAVEATRPERRAKLRECLTFGGTGYTAAEARSIAKQEGWVRHREGGPEFPGSTDLKTRTFDICPVCAPKVLESAG